MDAVQYIVTCIFRTNRKVDEDAVVGRFSYKPLSPLCGY
jgi:hypothetical protein